MKFESKKKIQELENKLQCSYKLPILRGYVAINKRGVEQIIDSIYENLPQDVLEARKFLKSWNNDVVIPTNTENKKHLYNYLNILEQTLNKQISIASYVIVKVQEIENIVNQIYKNIPDEINKAENLER